MRNKINISIIILFCIIVLPFNDLFSQDYMDFIEKDAVEMLEQRTENTKTFLNKDNSRTILLFPYAIHNYNYDKSEWEDLAEDSPIEFPFEELITIKKSIFNSSLYTRAASPYPLFGSGRHRWNENQIAIDRAFVLWKPYNIPIGSTIINSKFSFSRGTTSSFQTYKLTRMEKNPDLPNLGGDNGDTLKIRYDDIGDGTPYVTGINGYSQRIFEFDNTHSFNIDLGSRLISYSHSRDNWMAVGILNDDESDNTKYLGFDYQGPGYNILAVTYTPPVTPVLSVNPMSWTAPSNGGNKPITVLNSATSSIINYTASINVSWLEINGSNGPYTYTGSTPNGFVLSAELNSGSTTRTAQCTVKAPSLGDSIKIITITQNPNTPAILTIGDSLWNASGDGDSLTVSVTNTGNANSLNYTVTETTPWISLSSTSGTTPSSFKMNAAKNFTGLTRYTQVFVASNPPVPGSPRIINISQNPASILTLPDDEVSDQETYIVSDWIAANTFLVNSNGNVENLTLGAGNKITLKPGFTATSSNGTFRAYIHNFGDFMDASHQDENIASKNPKVLSLKKGKSMKTETDNIEIIPTEYDLFQNYPNPFNPTTNIKFALPERSYVNLAVYNLIGQKVAELTNNELEAGYHSIQFNGSMLSSGLYFYRITTNKFSKTYKMLLVK